ncbi:ABC transporter ATP-binding protein [Portibacter marinus]|uniref:ABC transporter ATP-binding protein n=1 Tax=Portibacter marinus TaxID=2898660 RepID=UPI001F2CBEFB|nr:ATP-binding cassette domain-containing protein [Portibacter marinus]
MDIILENISKRYGSQWIFRNIDYRFTEQGRYAIIGSNGAGKSTLLQVVVGKIPFTKGEISYQTKDGPINVDQVFRKFSIATTAMALIEEFSLEEIVRFHFRFRKPIGDLELDELLNISELKKESKKYIRDFSSGMKQRLKLVLAVLTESEVVILDEPGANLDEASKLWYQRLLNDWLGERTLIVASNEAEDYKLCDQFLDLSLYK